LFIDEIHRFSKSQQDSLLGAVEQGIITLTGATTENPSFEVIAPLLSRCQVYILEPLSEEDLLRLIDRALRKDPYISRLKVDVRETEALLRVSGGDARKLYNALELVIASLTEKDESSEIIVTNEKVLSSIQKNLALYDKGGRLIRILFRLLLNPSGKRSQCSCFGVARKTEVAKTPYL
jgi:putative ATPase